MDRVRANIQSWGSVCWKGNVYSTMQGLRRAKRPPRILTTLCSAVCCYFIRRSAVSDVWFSKSWTWRQLLTALRKRSHYRRPNFDLRFGVKTRPAEEFNQGARIFVSVHFKNHTVMIGIVREASLDSAQNNPKGGFGSQSGLRNTCGFVVQIFTRLFFRIWIFTKISRRTSPNKLYISPAYNRQVDF